MLQDALALFENATAITDDRISTNVMDVQHIDNALSDNGTARDACVVITVTEAFATATSITIALQSDSTADLATSATTHSSTGAIAIANLTAGTQVLLDVPQQATYERYVGLLITVTGSNATAGKFIAALMPRSGVRVYKAYADRSSF